MTTGHRDYCERCGVVPVKYLSGERVCRDCGWAIAEETRPCILQDSDEDAGRVWDPKPEPFDGRVRVGEDPGDCQASDDDYDSRERASR